MDKDILLDGHNSDAMECIIHDFNNDNSYRDEKNEPLPQLVGGTVAETLYTDVDPYHHMKPFWEGYRRPFATLGIDLCSLRSTNHWALLGDTTSSPLPFAFRCTHEQEDEPGRLNTTARYLMSRFAYAQDERRRDTVIKLVDKGSMEHKIYRYLAECKSLYDTRVSVGVLPPSAIVGSPYSFAFVAMPMWGTNFSLDELDTLREVMTFIRCTLSGLSFLHHHRIAHRDIDHSNILINWYCSNVETARCAQRLREHSRSPAASYALFDFDLSLQLPPETSLKDCRRPAEESFTGKRFFHPADVHQGERHYNPFAFDVACLGNLYLSWFSEAIPVAPHLAPLIGKMTTHIVDDRWSAEEALAFFDDFYTRLPPDLLDSTVALSWDTDPVDQPDLYWNRLTPDFQSSWKTHRPPALSWIVRVLRWVNTTHVGWNVVTSVRRYLQI